MRLAFRSSDPIRCALAEGWVRALGSTAVSVERAGEPPDAVSRHLRRVGVDLARPPGGAGPVDCVIGLEAGAAGDEIWPLDGPLPELSRQLRERLGDWLGARGLQVRLGRAVRDRFLLREDMTFLNHGSFGATPRAVLEARHALEQELEAQPVRFMLGVEDRLREVIARLAPHLGAEPAGLVFVDNATTGVNAVLASLGLRPGDRILVTDHGYEGVRHAVDHLCERTGARKVVVRVPFPVTDADEVVEALARGLDRHRPRLCIVDHLTSITAVVMPVGRIVRACHAREVPVLVDGAHVPGQLPVDLRALGADFWVGNLHKWMLAPKGTAVLHVAERWRDRVQPTVISLGHGRDLHARFAWPGTRDPCGWLATDAALDLLEALGADRVRAWGIRQREEAATVLAEAWDAPPTAPPELQAAMATVRLPFDAGGDWEAGKRLGRQLWERHRVETMFPPFAGRTWARISLPLYAELDDVRRLVEVLGPEGVA